MMRAFRVALVLTFLVVQAVAFGGVLEDAVPCEDDPDGSVAASGNSCAMMQTLGCDTDLNPVDPRLPAGTLVKMLCPLTCGVCGGEPPAMLSMTPTELPDGTYEPSPFAISVAAPQQTDYTKMEWANPYTGSDKILVVCTDDGKMIMTNGKVFSSGNHPVEMMLPLMHLRDAGFEFQFVTVSGGPVVVEMWAFPNEDEDVKQFYEEIKSDLENPLKIEDIAGLEGYAAIFMPGGHGAMINLPQSAALGVLLRQANELSLPTVALCHGPAALLSATVDGPFPYEGYEAVTFSDNTDKMSTSIGYIPGEMEWYLQETLRSHGMTVDNQSEQGETKVDRELITGDGPPAANALGLVATPMILEYAQKGN